MQPDQTWCLLVCSSITRLILLHPGNQSALLKPSSAINQHNSSCACLAKSDRISCSIIFSSATRAASSAHHFPDQHHLVMHFLFAVLHNQYPQHRQFFSTHITFQPTSPPHSASTRSSLLRRDTRVSLLWLLFYSRSLISSSFCSIHCSRVSRLSHQTVKQTDFILLLLRLIII